MLYKFITEDKTEALEMEYSNELVDIINKTLNHLSNECKNDVSYKIIYNYMESLIRSKGFGLEHGVKLYIPDDEGC
jgi:hypothetical protein